MDKTVFQIAMRAQIQDYANLFKKTLEKPRPREGWIKTIRMALGMSTYQLANRMGHRQSNIVAYERREREGTISLKNLQAIAESLNCRLIYAFVPEKDLEQILEDRARFVLRKQLHALEHSMKLEQQGLTSEQEKKNEDLLIREMIQKDIRKLWEIAD